MWSTLHKRYSEPIEHARWRVAAFQSLLREHRATLNGRTQGEWSRDDKELSRIVTEARWTAQLLESSAAGFNSTAEPTAQS
jgi:hypothetical protein